MLGFPDCQETLMGLNLFYNQKSFKDQRQKQNANNVKKLGKNYMNGQQQARNTINS
jgi:hypothetical protein